jgi:thioredoxin reductase (NADPH)
MSTQAHKLVIIGSGPAGWTAAIYAARAQLDPVVYIGVPKQDPGPVLPGGQLMLTTEVENYPGFPKGITGPEMMAHFQAQAERFGTRIAHEDIVRCEFSLDPVNTPHALHTSEGKTVHAHAVIIATGAVANWMGLESEMHLARNGGGVSACAVCDGALPPFRNQPLAVVGGGDTAMEEATYLTKFGSVVYIIHRRDTFRASRIMQERFMSRPNAKVLWNKVVTEVKSTRTPDPHFEGQFIEKISGVDLKDTKTGETSHLPLAGLFIAIGHTPATKFLMPTDDDLARVDLSKVHNWYEELALDDARGAALRAKRNGDNRMLPADWPERYKKLTYLYHQPDNRFVAVDPSGYIEFERHRHPLSADSVPTSRTNLPGVFAAGDVADSQYRQAISAAGMGCVAALDAERWLGAAGVH